MLSWFARCILLPTQRQNSLNFYFSLTPSPAGIVFFNTIDRLTGPLIRN